VKNKLTNILDDNLKDEVYNMPLYMVKRKRKCKHFKEYREGTSVK